MSSSTASKPNTKESNDSASSHSRPLDLIVLCRTTSSSSSLDETIKQMRLPVIQDAVPYPQELTDYIKKRINQRLYKVFICDLQPFSLLKNEGFKELVYALNPAYELPSMHYVSNTIIPSLFDVCVTEVRSILSKGTSFCLTTDCWTSNDNISYVAVTAHFVNDDFKLISAFLDARLLNGPHTKRNLADAIRNIADKWGILNKIFLVVSDNTVNIKSAITDELKWKHFGCFALTVNIILKDALNLDVIKTVIEKVKTVVRHFKRNTSSVKILISFQKIRGNEPLELIEDVPTRWNATFHMLKRFCELETIVTRAIAVIDKNLPVLTSDEWKILTQLVYVLKPFESVSQLNGKSCCTGSMVIPLIAGMKYMIKRLVEEDIVNEVRSVLIKIDDDLVRHFGDIESANTLSICAFLDPRFKIHGFPNEQAGENTKRMVTDLVCSRLQAEFSARSATPTNETETDLVRPLSVWSSLYEAVSKLKSKKGTPMSKAVAEVQRYLDEDLFPRESDPLEWWKINALFFPQLWLLAKENLCAAGTCVPCENVFSKVGQVINSKRSMLSSKEVKMLLFLNNNFKFLNNE